MKQVIVTPVRNGEYAEDRAQEVWEYLLTQRERLGVTVSLVDTLDRECPICHYPLDV